MERRLPVGADMIRRLSSIAVFTASTMLSACDSEPAPASYDASPDAAPDACTPSPFGPDRLSDLTVEGPARDSQVRAALAHRGDGWFAVWQDDRRDEGGDIFGARLAGDGTVLDPHGIPISITGGGQETPRVAWGGGVGLVVWVEYATTEIRATRIDAAGTVLDPHGFALGAGADPDVTFDGTRFVVVYAGTAGHGVDVLGVRVSTAGTVLDAPGVPIVAETGAQGRPSIAAGPAGQLLMTWLDVAESASVQATRLSSELVALDAGGVHLGGDARQEPARIAFGADTYAVTWARDLGDGNGPSVVLARRLSLDGVPLDSAPLVVAQSASRVGGGAVAYDGTSFALAWHRQTDPQDDSAFDIEARRMAPSGALIEPTAIVLDGSAGQQARPALASGAGTTLVAWDGMSDEPWDIFATRVHGDGTITPLPVSRLTSSTNTQLTPHIVANRAGSTLLYLESGKGASAHPYTQPLDVDGSPATSAQPVMGIDPDFGFFHGTLANGPTPVAAAARWTAGVVGTDIVMTRLGPDGRPIDGADITITGGDHTPMQPSIASDGRDYLVVWHESGGVDDTSTIRGARVSGAGSVLDPAGFQIGEGVQSEFAPSVAFGAGVYMVTWGRLDTPHYSLGGQIDVAIVSTAGEVSRRFTLDSPDPRRDKVNPKIAFDGTSFLIVWELHLWTGWQVYATRVQPDGSVLDGPGIAISSDPDGGDAVLNIDPSVVFAGGEYWVGWRDEYLMYVTAQRVGTDGVLRGDPVVLADHPLGQRALSLGVGGDGAAYAAFERFDATAGTWRLAHRRLATSCH